MTESNPNERPVCASCGGRHWFLEVCIDAAATSISTAGSSEPLKIDPPASQDEIERAVRFYRKHRERQRQGQRRRRAQPATEQP